MDLTAVAIAIAMPSLVASAFVVLATLFSALSSPSSAIWRGFGCGMNTVHTSAPAAGGSLRK
jgi:hypothetical protein